MPGKDHSGKYKCTKCTSCKGYYLDPHKKTMIAGAASCECGHMKREHRDFTIKRWI